MAIRSLKRILIAAMLATAATAGTAQTAYPSRPVKVIVSLPPGSGADTTARFIAQQLGEKFRQPFVVENRPGANSFIGARAAAEASPDGYTLFVGSNSSMVTNVAVFKSVPYDPIKDFVPVERIARFAMVVVVPASSPYNSLDDLVQAARTSPGKLNYASGSAGYQVAAELFHERFHIKSNAITYKGTAPAITDAAAGNVDYSIGEISSVLPLIRSGRLRALAVTDTQRLKDLPQVPTVAESGAPGFEVFAWTGVFAPAKVPAPIIKTLSNAVREAMQQRDSARFIENLGGTVFAGGPQELRQFQLAEIQRTREIVRTAGIPVE